MRGLARWVSVLAATVLVLSACSDDKASPPPVISDSPASYDPAVLPDRPADQNTAEGAEAFGRYAIAVLFYSSATIDPGPITEIGDMDTCPVCRNARDAPLNPDLDVTRSPTSEPIVSVSFAPQYDASGCGCYQMEFTLDPLDYKESSIETGEVQSVVHEESSVVIVYAEWKDGQWWVQRIAHRTAE